MDGDLAHHSAGDRGASMPDLMFAGDGEMAALMRAVDWAATPIGPVRDWPQSLRTAVSICLHSQFPLLLLWGPDLVVLYNDAYRPILGATKHPRALGQRGEECWPEIWGVIGPLLRGVLERGEAARSNDQRLILDRNGYPEECYFTFSYNPIQAESGGVGGVLCAVTETTGRVVNERRLRLLRTLSAQAGEADRAQAVCAIAARVIGEYGAELPFALIYLLDDERAEARLAGAAGLTPGTAAAPEVVNIAEMGAPTDRWRLGDVVRTGRASQMDDLQSRFSGLPAGLWDEAPHTALVLPLMRHGRVRPAGLLVAGVSPHRALDEDQRGFLQLIAGQIAAAVADAGALEAEHPRTEWVRALRESEAQLEADLADAKRLQAISTELIADEDVSALYNTILDAAVSVMRADYASMQILDPERGSGGELHLLAFRGFSPQAAAFWEWVRVDSHSTCGMALRTGKRVIVPDVETCEFMAGTENLAMYLQTGIHAVQTTPLVSRNGRILGMISTHWRRPHQPAERTLRLLDIVARQAADLIERRQVEAALAEAAETDAYLVALADALRPLTDPAEIQAAAAHVLGDHLAAGRVLYVEIEPDDETVTIAEPYVSGMPKVVARRRLADFGAQVAAAFRAGRTLAIADIAVEPMFADAERAVYLDLGVRAYVGVPLVKGGRFVAAFGVHQSEPRTWTSAEIALVRETAERTWAAVERARAEAGSRESEERLARIVENIAEGVVTIGPDGRYLSINAAGERILGVERDEFLGRTNAQPPYRRLTLEGESLGEAPTITEVAASGAAVFRHEYLIERTDGTRTAIERKITAVRAENGSFLGAVSTFSDITIRRQIEEVRERLLAAEQAARVEAEAANRAKDEFLAVLSHELRTPLTTILGFGQMLRRQPNLPTDQVLLAIESIDRNARIQARLVEDLLDVSRILSGKLSMETEPVDLTPVVETAVAGARPDAESKGLTLTSTVDAATGPVLGDAGRLQQVVVNLISNAVKFTPAGGRIDVSLEQVGGEALISVIDTGAGIPADFLPQVFERFRQRDSSTTRAYGGLGLGLAIAQHLVKQHGGRIAAESGGEGQGATFRVWLPLAKRETPPGSASEAVAPAARLRGVQVLVVDDDDDTREFLRVLLEDEGATVHVAGSSAEALTAIVATRFDVLIADIGMPVEDGYTLIEQVRAIATSAGSLPALALTAYTEPEHRQKALSAGFQQHLPKPVDTEALVVTIAELTGGARHE